MQVSCPQHVFQGDLNPCRAHQGDTAPILPMGILLNQPMNVLMLCITLAPLKNYGTSHGLAEINHCLTVCAHVFMKSLEISACSHQYPEESVHAVNEPQHHVITEIASFQTDN